MFRLGTDIIYIPRIQAAVERFGDRFIQRVYTPAEQLDCGYSNPFKRSSIKQLAGRWAAKEAIVKALGTGWRGVGYTEVEIRRQPSGAPVVYLHRRAATLVAAWGKGQWQLSLSHEENYAIATVLFVGSTENFSHLES